MRRLIFLSIFLVFVSFLFSFQKVKEKDLPQKYREWLELTHYIIHPKEKEVFLQLTTDRERDIFIESFWEVRDPTPGTPQNEYKEEHIQRFLYANKHLKRGSPRKGWMTDMGRIYIILGPPSDIDRFDLMKGIYPAEVWYFYGDQRKGLPPYFGVVFFKRGGSGEYKLYNPVSDGPASLLVETRGLDVTNYQNVYEKIKDLAPDLAGVSISMIPGEYPYNYIPSPRSNIILADIFESPLRDISPTYATHFLNYKGIVTTEYLTNYVESVGSIAFIHDPLRSINMLHFSLSPKDVSVVYYGPDNKYYCNFALNVSLRKESSIILQYSKDFPFYFPPNDLPKIKGMGISIQDSFPLIEGEYRLNILLQNSVGKEFTVYEKDIFFPEDSRESRIIGPFLGYEIQDHSLNIHAPFKIGNKRIIVDPNYTFSSSDEIVMFFNILNLRQELSQEGEVEILITGLREENPSKKSFSIKLKEYPYHNVLSIHRSFIANELSPDYYEMKLNLKNGDGETIDEKKSTFVISPKKVVSHPISLFKTFPLSQDYILIFTVASLYDKVKNYKQAELYYEKAYQKNPAYKEGLIEYANFLFKLRNFDKILELIEGLKKDDSSRFEYYLIKGRALMGLGRYSEAINNLLEGNKIYDSDTRLLNSLGFCYYKTNQVKKALEALNASLRLNPKQNEMRKLVDEINRRMSVK
jgi:GWxTD domain-containing protein